MPMSVAGYTRGDVAFLLSLDHMEALAHASGLKDSIGKLTEERGNAGFCPDDSDVPFIAQWVEVNAAAQRIRAHKEDIALTQLRLQGYSDEEVAGMLGLGRRTVGRRWRATLNEILEQLGGEVVPDLPLDHIDMCLKCGRNPRGRTMRRTRLWTSNGWRWKMLERPSSMCATCLGEAAERMALAAAA